jgi:hypothetical protein
MAEKDVDEGTQNLVRVDNPQVFVSHDTRDADIAEAFSKLLSSVSAGVLKSFRSSDNKGNQGIEYGVEWYPKIIDALQKASDVVCLLTENSLNRPWILFEAGMAKGKLNTPILGIAVGIPLSKVSTGPFAQFQNSDDEEGSLTKLVKQLVKKIPNSEPDEDVIKFQVQQFKKKVEQLTKSKKPEQSEPKGNGLDIDSTVKLFEEVKIMFKELPSRLEKVSSRGQVRERRMHPGMLEELAHFSYRVDPKIGIQMVLSVVRSDFPWIYDSAIEAIEKIKRAKTMEGSKKILAGYMRIIEMTFEHPLMRDVFVDGELGFRIFKEVPRIIYDLMRRFIEDKKYE